MKSKTSYFNKTIFYKNIGLYWPLWISFFLLLLISMPICLQLNLVQNGLLIEKEMIESNKMEGYAAVLNIRIFLPIIAVYAVIYSMCVFGYLHNTRATNMIHSLPVTRTELFITNYLSGISCLVVPEILTFIVTILVCINNGISKIQYVAIWLGIAILASLLFYGMAVFCNFLTGQVLAVPVLYFVLNFIYPGFQLFSGILLSHNGYGISINNVYDAMDCPMACPFLCLYRNAFFDVKYKTITGKDGSYMYAYDLSFSGGLYLAVFLLCALLFTVLAWFMYRKRCAECSQDFLAFGSLKPLFRWGIGIGAGWVAGIAVYAILIDFYINVNRWGQGALVVFFSIIMFFVSEMLIQKGFRVFAKKRLRECLVFSGIVVVSIFAVRAGTDVLENKMPVASEVQVSNLQINGWKIYHTDELDKILSLQKKIIARKEDFRYYDNLEKYQDKESFFVRVYYQLKNGKELERQFNIPAEEGMEILSYMKEDLRNPTKYLDTYFDFKEEQIVGFEEGTIELYKGNGDFVNKEIDEEASRALYEAIRKEAEAERFQKYNGGGLIGSISGYDSEIKPEETYYQEIYLEFNVRVSQEEFLNTEKYYGSANVIASDYVDSSYITRECYGITFGTDCEYILETLKKYQIIQSEEDLITIDRMEEVWETDSK